jgi:hypothetical protein
MVLSGEVIEYKNNEKKTGVLYPRGRPVITQIKGVVTVNPGQQYLKTSIDLRKDVWRGDAIKVGNYWYRVSAYTGVGDDRWNKFASSVTTDTEPTSTRGFRDDYTATSLPLDADYEGPVIYTGPICKHGSTNDIRQCWQNTALEMKKNITSEEALLEELLRNKLISRSDVSTQSLISGRKRFQKDDMKKTRKKTVRSNKSGVGGYHNAHLRGTELERIVNETYENILKHES